MAASGFAHLSWYATTCPGPCCQDIKMWRTCLAKNDPLIIIWYYPTWMMMCKLLSIDTPYPIQAWATAPATRPPSRMQDNSDEIDWGRHWKAALLVPKQVQMQHSAWFPTHLKLNHASTKQIWISGWAKLHCSLKLLTAGLVEPHAHDMACLYLPL